MPTPKPDPRRIDPARTNLRLPAAFGDLVACARAALPPPPADDAELVLLNAVESDSAHGEIELVEELVGEVRGLRNDVVELFAHLGLLFGYEALGEAKVRAAESVVRSFVYGFFAARRRFEGSAEAARGCFRGVLDRARDRRGRMSPSERERHVAPSDEATVFQAYASEVEARRILNLARRREAAERQVLWYAVAAEAAIRAYEELVGEVRNGPAWRRADDVRARAAAELALMQAEAVRGGAPEEPADAWDEDWVPVPG